MRKYCSWKLSHFKNEEGKEDKQYRMVGEKEGRSLPISEFL